MSVIFYAGRASDASQKLRQAIEEALPEGKAEAFNSIEGLTRRLREPRAKEITAVLLAGSPQELADFLSIQNLLLDLRIILILPDGKKDTVAQGLILRPRFLTVGKTNFSAVAAVLSNMEKERFLGEGKETSPPGGPAFQAFPGGPRLETAELQGDPNGGIDSLSRLGHMAALGGLLGSFLHDLKNSLVSLKVLAELLPERYGDEDFRNTLHNLVISEIGKTQKQIEGLLEFSRPSEKRLQRVNLHALLLESEGLIAGEARNRNLILSNDLAPELPPVRTDGRRVKQLLVSLLLNVLQALPPGGTLRTETRVLKNLDETREKLFIQVEIGSPQGMSLTDGGRNPRSELGLALLRQEAKELDGAIVFGRREGGGESWRLHLPLEGDGRGGER